MMSSSAAGKIDIMHTYAQTNVQLFNQLRSEGYSKNERQRVLTAYELAMRLFTGLFLPSGRPFIDHLVGTASILAWLRVPVEIVTAGLIHAAYLHGDFGDAGEGVSNVKRKQVKHAVGEVVEEYVARYDRFLWNQERILIVRDTLDRLPPIDRNVLLMRLANELEHELDLGVLYCVRSEKEQKWHQGDLERYGPIMMEMSKTLGFPSLAAEMERVFRIVRATQIPVRPTIVRKRQTVYVVTPKSYCERLFLKFHRKLMSGCRSGVRVVHRAASECRRSSQSVLKLLQNVFSN
jgi:(p)ppGpp synthase/HD superfamily hydrolase